jgi:LDH2 family malate/lactate/ureidoglycolate dehydrogenase
MAVETVRVKREVLQAFCQGVFEQLGLAEADAVIAADVLIAADVRGIPSHGVARLQRYVNGLATGVMLPDAVVETVIDTPSSLVLDAHGAMGAPVSYRAMERVIEKAGISGSAFACVRDSNHFGIAGYYAMMALEVDMIGIAMTSTATLGVPTFGRQAMFGTNPLAFAAPAAKEGAFVLDMATTVVTRGKVEVYNRLEKELPLGWAVDKKGAAARDAGALLDDFRHSRGGGILPLGGMGEQFGGHKGYGLAVMVDILCGVLCGTSFGLGLSDTASSSGRVSHFFGAIQIERFREPVEFRRDMDKMLQDLRECPTAEGAERVYFAGLKEMEHEAEVNRDGVPMLGKTYSQLCEIGTKYGTKVPDLMST